MLLGPFFVFLACLFITYALFLLTSRNSDAKRARLNERLAEAIRSSAHSQDSEVQLARQELLSEIPWMNRTLVKLEISIARQAHDRSGGSPDYGDAAGALFIDGWRTGVSRSLDADYLLPGDGPLRCA